MRKLSRLAASLILSLALGLLAAQRTAAQSSGFVAGTVVEEGTQRPVAGAQVVAEGVGLGTITDARGRFRIEGLSPGRVTLRVQMLGYQNAAQAASVGSGEVRFALSQAAIELDQIVVTGTAGGSRQRAVGNAVARVDAARISEVAPVTSMSQLIGGREPGVNILPGSGNVGTGSVLKVRGNSSVSLRNQPLVYVDGIRVDNNPEKGPSIRQGRQVSALDDINPNDIERVEVIKGPAAATLYGTEASGGLIQIITKRGTSGAPSFDLQVRQGATWLMNVEDKLPDSYGTDPQTGELFSVNLLELERTAGREVFRTGHLQTYSLGMRGGNEQMRY